MIAWGIETRNDDFAPLKWMVGLLLLVAIPLENCLIRNPRAKTDGGKEKG
jgi:hypothetical protein